MRGVRGDAGIFGNWKQEDVVALTNQLPEFRRGSCRAGARVIGVLPGEGIGPAVVSAALHVLSALSDVTGRQFDVRFGGAIGSEALQSTGKSLTPEVASFCDSIFADQGVLFCGAGGARFVYDLRTQFDLFCKFTPLLPEPSLLDSGPLRPEVLRDVDIVAVRENLGGLYYGDWGCNRDESGRESAYHRLGYHEDQVDRIITVAARLAQARRGGLTLVVKREGTPSVSALWLNCFRQIAESFALECQVLDIDNAAYQLVADPRQFDVVVSSNMFGDVLADTGAVLLGSRGMSFSGNYGDRGQAAYQTGHGAAYDLAGSDRANPLGQILSLAFLLEESFQWTGGASLVRRAVSGCLDRGFCTADLRIKGGALLGTTALGERVAEELIRLASGHAAGESAW